VSRSPGYRCSGNLSSAPRPLCDGPAQRRQRPFRDPPPLWGDFAYLNTPFNPEALNQANADYATGANDAWRQQNALPIDALESQIKNNAELALRQGQWEQGKRQAAEVTGAGGNLPTTSPTNAAAGPTALQNPGTATTTNAGSVLPTKPDLGTGAAAATPGAASAFIGNGNLSREPDPTAPGVSGLPGYRGDERDQAVARTVKMMSYASPEGAEKGAAMWADWVSSGRTDADLKQLQLRSAMTTQGLIAGLMAKRGMIPAGGVGVTGVPSPQPSALPGVATGGTPVGGGAGNATPGIVNARPRIGAWSDK
jgi:hypothetical protein